MENSAIEYFNNEFPDKWATGSKEGFGINVWQQDTNEGQPKRVVDTREVIEKWGEEFRQELGPLIGWLENSQQEATNQLVYKNFFLKLLYHKLDEVEANRMLEELKSWFKNVETELEEPPLPKNVETELEKPSLPNDLKNDLFFWFRTDVYGTGSMAFGKREY